MLVNTAYHGDGLRSLSELEVIARRIKSRRRRMRRLRLLRLRAAVFGRRRLRAPGDLPQAAPSAALGWGK